MAKLTKEEVLARRIYKILVSRGRPMHIQEIYKEIPDKPETTIRGRIYTNLAKLFKRVAKGVYCALDPETGGGVIVLRGNGRDLSFFADGSVDAIVTDHPWQDEKSHRGGNRGFVSTYEDNCFRYTLDDFKEKARVLRPGGFLVEVLPAENENNYEYLYQIKKMAEECGLYYYAKVPWKKGTFVANTGRKAKNTEDIMFFTKGKARALRPDVKKTKATGEPHYMSGTAYMLPTEFDCQPPGRNERIHQAEKPVSLYEQILEAVTLPGEIVVDQFAGSGNLGKAAIKKGRIAVLFENMKEHIKTIKKNLGAKKLSFE